MNLTAAAIVSSIWPNTVGKLVDQNSDGILEPLLSISVSFIASNYWFFR
jgi:hypothetical protein